ncbi:MAG: GatB/YqeY domain-containing protein [Chloroflexi bacterium]|nr:GatB/YqeY domain-containing protein [Chloroflexota bacterium]
MSLKETLRNDMVAAMRAGDAEKRNALRMLMAAIKQVEIDDKVDLDDKGVLSVLTKQAKQRRESIAEYEKAGRDELAAVEKTELAIIDIYLPKLMSREEVHAIASAVIAELGVTDMKGMGQIMGKLMPKVKGKADGRIVNEVVREILQNQ